MQEKSGQPTSATGDTSSRQKNEDQKSSVKNENISSDQKKPSEAV